MRAELLGQLVAVQFEIEAALKETAGNVSAASESVTQLQLLNALQRQIGSANPAALAGMRSEIIAAASTAQVVALQTRAAADTDSKIANLGDVTKRTGQTIKNLAYELFEEKKLDPYLRFQSAEDEAEYRKREAERKAYIEQELAKGTPEGTRNAQLAFKEQLKDAGAHGADASPDYPTMLAKAEQAEKELLAAMPDPQMQPTGQKEPAKNPTELDDILAAFRDAGVSNLIVEEAQPAHGLAQGKLAGQIKSV